MFVTLKVKVISDATCVVTEIPAILTSSGVLEPLVDYLLFRSHDRSRNWMIKVVQAVALFLAYLMANPNQRDTRQLFQDFAQRLLTGTFGLDGLDPSGLCWNPRSQSTARMILNHLTEFFSWLADKRGRAAVNPAYLGGEYDRMVDEAAYRFRRDRAFLGHTWNPRLVENGAGGTGQRVRSRRPPKVDRGNPPAFPEDRFLELLDQGFCHAGQPSYRDILITLLLHGAGFRESEPFHLFIGDVMEDPTDRRQALVLIHHPSEGTAPADWHDERGRPIKGNRAAYLSGKYGLPPRTEILGSQKAGWKGGMHDGPYFKRSYWFVPMYGRLFLSVWYLYLKQLVHYDRTHPFAFINLSGPRKGEPYAIEQYRQAHARACRRIGLEVGKQLGTTPHGHRHAYGRRLRQGDVPPDMIRRFLHHTSLESQAVYTTPTMHEVMQEIAAAAQRLAETSPKAKTDSAVTLEKLLEHGFEDVDPDGWLSGPKQLGKKDSSRQKP